MEPVLTIDMIHDAETLKNEVVEDKPPKAFEDQTLETTDTLIAGEKPARCQFLYHLSLCQWKQCSKQIAAAVWQRKEGVPYTGFGKLLHDEPTIVKVNEKNNCHFHSIVYLLTGSQD